MTRERHESPVRGIVLAMLVCVAVMISSCSTVNTFLSTLDADSFARPRLASRTGKSRYPPW